MSSRALVGLVEVAFLIPRDMSWSRGQALSEKLPCGPLTRWRWRTADSYVLMVCHLSPFRAKYAANSIS